MRISTATSILAFLLVCTSSAAGMTSEEAVKMALQAEKDIQSISSDAYSLIKPGKSTTSTTTIEGITYTVEEYTDPKTGETLKMMYDQNDNLVQIDYFDPVTNTALTTEYDENGNAASTTILTTDEDGNPLMSITVTASGGGCSTYTFMDYTSTVDNMTTAEICDNNVVELTVHTCSNTLQSEITF